MKYISNLLTWLLPYILGNFDPYNYQNAAATEGSSIQVSNEYRVLSIIKLT